MTLFSLAAILFQIAAHFSDYTDYIGLEPDGSRSAQTPWVLRLIR